VAAGNEAPVTGAASAHQIDEAGRDCQLEDDAEQAEAQKSTDERSDNRAGDSNAQGAQEADPVGDRER